MLRLQRLTQGNLKVQIRTSFSFATHRGLLVIVIVVVVFCRTLRGFGEFIAAVDSFSLQLEWSRQETL